MRSFVLSDIYRALIGCERQERLLEALARHGVDHDGSVRRMVREMDCMVSLATVFAERETLLKLAACADLRLLRVDNMSARLRAVPVWSAAQTVGAWRPAVQAFGIAA